MQALDDLGNPLPYELGGFECPEGMVCVTEESFNEMLEPYDMEYSTETLALEPKGDAEAVIDFTTQFNSKDYST